MIEEEQVVSPSAQPDEDKNRVKNAMKLLCALLCVGLFIGTVVFHSFSYELLGGWLSLVQALSALGLTGLISMSKRVRRQCRAHIAWLRSHFHKIVLIVYVDSDRQWARWLEETLEHWGCEVLSLNWQPHISFKEELEEAQKKARKTFFFISLELLARLKSLKQAQYDEKSYRSWERRHLLKKSHKLIFLHEKAWQDFRLKKLAPGNFASIPNEEEAERALRRWLTPWVGSSRTNQVPTRRIWRYPGAKPAGWNVPDRSKYFIGRAREKVAILKAFQSNQAVVVLHGLRGYGKTEIAKEYAHIRQDKYAHVLWLGMETSSQYKIDLRRIISALNMAEPGTINGMRTSSLEQVLRQWLSKHDDWLLILDECQQATTVKKLYNQSMNGHVLITTSTRPEDFTNFTCIKIGEMEEEDARSFITTALKSDNGASTSSLSDEVAKNMLQQLGKVPEMLQALCLYIRNTSGSPEQYLVGLAQRRQNRQRQRNTGNHSQEKALEDSWMFYFDKIQERSAEEIMKYCALLHPGPIPVELIANISQLCLSDAQLTDALGKLGYYFLVERNLNDELSVKPHIHAYFRDWLEPATRKDLAVHLLQALSKTMLIPAVANIRTSLDYAIQAQACEELIQKYTLPDEDRAAFYEAYGHYLSEHAEFPKAEEYLRKGLALRQQLEQRGASNQSLPIARNGGYLARVLSAQGKRGANDEIYTQIEQYWQRLIAELQAAPGNQSLELATAYYNLARHYVVWRQPGEKPENGPRWAELQRICQELEDRWLQIARSSQDLTPWTKIDLLKQQGSLYSARNEYAKSIEKYEAALKLVKDACLDMALPSLQRRIFTVDAVLCQVRINRNMFKLINSNNQQDKQDPKVSRQRVQDLQEKVEASLEIVKKYPGKRHLEVAGIQMDLAEISMYIGDTNRAYTAYCDAEEIYRQIMPGHEMVEYDISSQKETIKQMGGSF